MNVTESECRDAMTGILDLRRRRRKKYLSGALAPTQKWLMTAPKIRALVLVKRRKVSFMSL